MLFALSEAVLKYPQYIIPIISHQPAVLIAGGLLEIFLLTATAVPPGSLKMYQPLQIHFLSDKQFV